jgi:hypothetical protein
MFISGHPNEPPRSASSEEGRQRYELKAVEKLDMGLRDIIVTDVILLISQLRSSHRAFALKSYYSLREPVSNWGK